ncbi:MAG: YdbL family protein [Opitutales bacterium]|jgi:hypothetical protein
MKSRFTSLLAAVVVAFAALFAVAPAAQAQSPGIRQRMQERLPQIDAMKEEGRVGENNQGYLAVRGSLNADENAVLAAENSDRSEVYEAIAKRTGSDADTVGRERAKQIADRTASGVWVQDSSGRWSRK